MIRLRGRLLWVNRSLKQGEKEEIVCEVGIQFNGCVVVLQGVNDFTSDAGWIADMYRIGEEVVFEEVRK